MKRLDQEYYQKVKELWQTVQVGAQNDALIAERAKISKNQAARVRLSRNYKEYCGRKLEEKDYV